ncbi:hypothetical protein Pint_20258 [Pistacia integerrima]|uniref:Uncharacterized protein n=1 Tax=Pistacia integerrima TaxID=434235 RepID=A0ACC0XC92_9ROSI|nr:hypothetical protein Pint_20258 [Pistacia integerrima]
MWSKFQDSTRLAYLQSVLTVLLMGKTLLILTLVPLRFLLSWRVLFLLVSSLPIRTTHLAKFLTRLPLLA